MDQWPSDQHQWRQVDGDWLGSDLLRKVTLPNPTMIEDSRLPPLYSISQNTVRAKSVGEDFDIVCEAGEMAVAVWGPLLRAIGAAETVRHLKARSLHVSSYHAGLRILELEDDEADAVIRATIEEAAAIEAPLASINPGPKGDRTFAKADEIFVTRLNRAAPLARKANVRLGIEPIHPFLCTNGYIHTLRHGAEIVARVAASALVVDTAHLFWDRDLFADIELNIAAVGLVQLGQLSSAQLAEKRWARAPFAIGAVPLAEILCALRDAGYAGYYEDETLLPSEMTRAERVTSIAAGAAWFRDLWHQKSED